ncbi:hypothetical protein BIW11_08476, partial [Tropilaelaps mercedesae]
MSAPLAVPEDLSQNRGRLLRLAETIKTKKKNASHRSVNLKNDPGYSPNIEHLVFATYRNVTSPPRYDKAPPSSGHPGPTTSRPMVTGGPGGGGQCAQCASIQCDPRTCACNNQFAVAPVHRGAVGTESSSPLRVASGGVQPNGLPSDRSLAGLGGAVNGSTCNGRDGCVNGYSNGGSETYKHCANSAAPDSEDLNGGHPDGERRRPLTLADQVFLSPLLRNPNSNDPTGILSPPGMFKDSDPATAI